MAGDTQKKIYSYQSRHNALDQRTAGRGGDEKGDLINEELIKIWQVPYFGWFIKTLFYIFF